MEREISARIKEKRKSMGLTQKDVAQSIHISQGQLSCIEAGKYMPPTYTLIELSRILQCSIDWILTGKEYAEENNMLKDFEILKQEDKDELLHLLKSKISKYEEEFQSDTLAKDNETTTSG